MKIFPSFLSAIDKQFKGPAREAVLRSIERITPFSKDDLINERVQLALLLIANGDKEKFEQELNVASSDWRDLLIHSELNDANWPQKLVDSGLVDEVWQNRTEAALAAKRAPNRPWWQFWS